MKRLRFLVLTSAALAACASPEATRQRGGGPGGDSGNRPTIVKMHEGSRQYWQTPVVIPGQGPELAPSEQARYLSLPSTPAPQASSSDKGQGQ